MTSEMNSIDTNGNASDGNCYPVHAAVAKALRSPLRPFDTYIGPYIAHKRGKLFLGVGVGSYAGYVCLWPGGVAPAYCKPVVCEYGNPDDISAAIAAARRTLRIKTA